MSQRLLKHPQPRTNHNKATRKPGYNDSLPGCFACAPRAGWMEAFNNDLVIRCPDRVVVKEDGYGGFKAGMTVEAGI